MSSPKSLVDNQGNAIRLGGQIGTGGEANVYAVDARPELVAKVYHSAPNAQRVEKLSHMVGLHNPELTKIAAWPLAMLHESKTRHVMGFLMPRIADHKELHTLYAPASRRKEFPNANWAFLAHVAMNCAAVFETVHGLGAVIADVNAKNVVVSTQGMVRLVDCDSFQFVVGRQQFLSEVGVPDYTPPELQTMSLTGVVRTVNHDRFGLAVLIFHLLFMGRHPFHGAFSGSGDMSAERAIKEFRFAYSSEAARFQMRQPPHSLPLGFLSRAVGDLFEKAFSRTQAAFRPDATAWLKALKDLNGSLVTCTVDATHRYPSASPVCAWCDIAAKGGPAFFYSANIPLTFASSPTDLEPVFEQFATLEAERNVTPTKAAPPIASKTPAPLPPEIVASKLPWPFSTVAVVIAILLWGVAMGTNIRSSTTSSRVGVIAGVAITLMLLLWRAWFTSYSAFGAERTKRAEALNASNDELGTVQQAGNDMRRNVGGFFQKLRLDVGAIRTAYAQLKPRYDDELTQLERNAAPLQRRVFLEDFEVKHANVQGIGPALLGNLTMYGFDTAYDLLSRDASSVPGIAEKRHAALMAWARGIERQFKFDPRKAVPEATRRALVHRFRTQQSTMRLELQNALEGARGSTVNFLTRQQELIERESLAREAAVQAQVDVMLTGTPSRAVVPVSLFVGTLVMVAVALVPADGPPSQPQRTDAQRSVPSAFPAVSVTAESAPSSPAKPPVKSKGPQKAAAAAAATRSHKDKPQSAQVTPSEGSPSDSGPVDPYVQADFLSDEGATPIASDPAQATRDVAPQDAPSPSSTEGIPRTLSSNAFHSALGDLAKSIERCSKDSMMAGDLVFGVGVSPDGTVETVTIESAPNTQLSNCAYSVLRGAAFPVSQNGGYFHQTLSVPFLE